MKNPRISVVIPVFNDEESLKVCLNAVFESHYEPFECIVVNDCSTDRSADIAAEFPATLINLEKRSGPAVARNRGVSAAQGEIILFIDGDVVITERTLQKIASSFEEHPEISGVQGIYKLSEKNWDLISAYQNDYYHYTFMHINHDFVGIAATYCFAVMKSHFEEIGGFRENIREPTVEDEELGYRLASHGRKIRLNKSLLVEHAARYNLKSFSKRKFRMTRNQTNALFSGHSSDFIKDCAKSAENKSHHPLSQMISLIILPLAFLFASAAPFSSLSSLLGTLSFLLFALLYTPFWFFFLEHRSYLECFPLIFLTVWDVIVMDAGILSGMFDIFRKKKIFR